jgi:ubiquinone biosynthesis protein UbiJ
MNLPVALCAALETALNAYLGQDAETAATLERIDGRLVAVHLEGLDLEFVLVPETSRIRVHGSLGDEPDAVIRATPLALLRVALAEQPAAALAGGDVRIEGDVEVGERLWGVLRAVEFDWEELMSRYIGDPLAHALGANARDLGARLRRNFAHTVDDLGEYVTEEARLSPVRPELNDFLDAVDRLREDIDRLEARLLRLEAASKTGADEA